MNTIGSWDFEMDNVIKWWATCTECNHIVEPFDDRKIIEAEIVLHKMKTGHRLWLRGKVAKEVVRCKGSRRVEVGKLV